MEKNARNFILDNLFSSSAYWVCAGTVIASLTSYFALPLPLANLITGFTGTLPLLQLFGGIWYARTTKKDRFVRCGSALWRVFLPMAFFAVLFPKNVGAVTMPIFYFLAVAVSQLVGPAQTDWMVSCVEGHVKKNYYAIREMFYVLSYSAVFCVVSLILYYSQHAGTQQRGFTIIACVMAAILAVSLVILMRLPAPLHTDAPVQPIRRIMTAPLHNKSFLRVFIMMIIWNFSCMFLGGFASLYQIRVLNLDFLHIMIWTTVASLLRAATAPFMARFASRIGWRAVTAVCIGVVAVDGILWMITTAQNILMLFPILTIIGALPNSGLNVGFLQLQVDNIPEKERNIYFSVSSTFSGIAALIGSAACSAVIHLFESIWGTATPNLRYIFLIGTLGVAVTALAALRIPEKRTAASATVK